MELSHEAGLAEAARPFKRKVFYLPGYDPRGARFYHQLYRSQAEAYGRLSGEAVSVSARKAGPGSTVEWTVANPAAEVATDYTLFAWDDIIRRSWIVNPVALFGRATRAYWNYLTRLDWPYVRTLPSGPLVTLAYPPLTAIFVPLAFLLLGTAVASAWLGIGRAALVGLAVALLAGYLVLHRLKSFWLLRFFIFNDELTREAGDPELDERLDLFADRIAAELADGDHHEVLLVTHSNGSILSVPLMERLLARSGGHLPDRFALLTLGHCIPLFSARRDGLGFHRQLAHVAAHRFRWVDIGYMPDGAAYSKVDPFGRHARERRVKLQQLSPRFFAFWSKAAYEKRRKNKYELHFDYLRCGETLSPIDHLSMTAGRRSLDEAIAAFRALGK